MNRRSERILWISIVSALLLSIAAIMLSPVAAAQSFGRNGTDEYIRELESVIYTLQNQYVDQVEVKELFEGAMNGIFATLDDPYSQYLDGDTLRLLTDTTKGKYGGVGLYISRDRFDKDNQVGRLPYVKVVTPIEDTPGWRAGINAGDYIYAIEGESAEDFSTQDVSDRLRGIPGSKVEVTILRGMNITFNVILTREEIEIPTVKTTVIGEDIGYLRIIEFTPFTESRVKDSLNQFSAIGVDKLVIDVRGNPGGLLDSVIDVADLFFSGGVVVSTKYRREQLNKVHRAAPGKLISKDMDIVVLINRGSASASEILTGALKDRGRATVIGETTFGKGSIQQMIALRNTEAAIKLTTGRYYTPNGNNIDKTGIKPDIEVLEPELSDEEIEDYSTLLQENRIGIFIDTYPSPNAEQINNFISDLRREGLDPGERNLRLMIRRESDRRLNVPPVVDLEYDRTLNRALQFLDSGQ